MWAQSVLACLVGAVGSRHTIRRRHSTERQALEFERELPAAVKQFSSGHVPSPRSQR